MKKWLRFVCFVVAVPSLSVPVCAQFNDPHTYDNAEALLSRSTVPNDNDAGQCSREIETPSSRHALNRDYGVTQATPAVLAESPISLGGTRRER